MKRPCVFFDRDNTLIVSEGYLGDPDQVRLVEGAADAVARARRLGYATVVVSNQSGVARGLFGEDAVRAVNARLDRMLLETNPLAVIDRHEYCPFHPEAQVEAYRRDSERRKPRPGMLTDAAAALALDLSRSWVIGDTARDVAAGRSAGCRTIRVIDPSLPASPEAAEASPEADFVVASLREAMDIVETRSILEKRSAPADAAAREPDAKNDAAKSAEAVARKIVPPAPAPSARLELLAEQILYELRRSRQHGPDFSVSKLLAGVTQVLALSSLFFAYLNRGEPMLLPILTVGLFMQTLTVALLLMGRT